MRRCASRDLFVHVILRQSNMDGRVDGFTINIDIPVIIASDETKRLDNLIRRIVDDRKMPTNPEKELLNLTVGNLVGA